MNRKRILILGAVLAFPLIVAGIYFAVGTPAALSPQKAAEAKGQREAARDLSGAVDRDGGARLAERTRTMPEDTDGWISRALLCRAGRYADSVVAYERAVERLPNDRACSPTTPTLPPWRRAASSRASPRRSSRARSRPIRATSRQCRSAGTVAREG